jgi:predicted TIM-barrel fold metal-dependent hydrolase
MTYTTQLPVQSCDCHVHVVEATGEYPMIAQRQYTAGPATLPDLRKHMASVGLGRAVIVQPSFYGTDNRVMLACLAQMAGTGRGVAVVEDNISDLNLQALHSGGVCGLRINVESSFSSDPRQSQLSFERALQHWSDRSTLLNQLGWHVQVFASLDLIARCMPMIRTMPFALVLDHFAMTPSPMDLRDDRMNALSDLLRNGRLWVKLSAPYRPPVLGKRFEEYFSTLARRLIDCNPERIVWGSDWPHTQREPGKSPLEVSAYRPISSRTLVQQIRDWLPSDTLQEQILVANPANLYRF